MNEEQANKKITATCPSGHRLRAGSLLVGKSVCCPKCHAEFVFGVTRSTGTGSQTVTDTSVMRILGEMPKQTRPEPVEATVQENRSVTDTGVMRILGPMSEPPPALQAPESLRPCSRCGAQIPETLAVCSHCHCYVGVLPMFMRQMLGGWNQHN